MAVAGGSTTVALSRQGRAISHGPDRVMRPQPAASPTKAQASQPTTWGRHRVTTWATADAVAAAQLTAGLSERPRVSATKGGGMAVCLCAEVFDAVALLLRGSQSPALIRQLGITTTRYEAASTLAFSRGRCSRYN